MSKPQNKTCFGITTIGEKGQAVIPMSARDALKLKKGDKLLVFGHDQMLVLSKLDNLEKIAMHLTKKLEAIQQVIKKGESA